MSARSGIANFLFEAGRLKRLPRSGWQLAGVDNCESVAEHTLRVAIIGYILAIMEQIDPGIAITMCLFHDFHETRIGDIDAIGKKYLDKNTELEHNIFSDQISCLPKEIRKSFDDLSTELFKKKSKLNRLVSDADKLECYIQALEYRKFKKAELKPFFNLEESDFFTNSAQQLFREIRDTENVNEWWQTL